MHLRRLLLPILLVFLTAGATLAAGRPPSPEEIQSLQRDAAAFVRATEKNDAANVIDALPPRIIGSVADQNGIPAKQVRGMLVDNARAFGAQAKARDVEVDLDDVRVRDAKSRAGSVVWTILPMRGTALTGSKRVAFEAETVAILENGTWHFARIDARGQAGLIRSAYPEIKGLPKR